VGSNPSPSATDMQRIHLIVHGQVQGVFYRVTAVEKARALGLTGWVRNADDGSVELVAEGDESSLALFLGWCAEGPPGAAVERIEHHDEPARGTFHNFDARY
jgi:acylphosphatase